jgi:phage N-6-adenine-methyltransferase
VSALPVRREGMTLVEADQLEADALDALDAVDTPEAAEALLGRIKLADQAIRLSKLGADREQRWGRIRLLGERLYGELLGPAEHGGDRRSGSTSTPQVERDYSGEHRAREVASVPEPVFKEYVETAEQPTRSGLLREAGKMDVHYSSSTDEWATPQDFYNVVHAEFGFDLDVCALDSSAKCPRYFTPDTDGLAQEWTGTVWMNPPYGDVIVHWVKKAWESAQAGATVVCLVPARTDTGWFQDYCLDQGEVRFLRGRLRFGNADASAPFPSCLVVLGPNAERLAYGWDWR